jgi:hypothetical protein
MCGLNAFDVAFRNSPRVFLGNVPYSVFLCAGHSHAIEHDAVYRYTASQCNRIKHRVSFIFKLIASGCERVDRQNCETLL